jgi:hypothetical protein
MKKNIGTIDKIIRITTAALIVAFYAFGWLNGASAIILLIIAGLLAVTSLISFCPLYALLKIGTNKKEAI